MRKRGKLSSSYLNLLSYRKLQFIINLDTKSSVRSPVSAHAEHVPSQRLTLAPKLPRIHQEPQLARTI